MLQPPKKTSSGFFLALTPPVLSPEVQLVSGTWTPTDAWYSWADEQRKVLLGELLSHGSWFSKPPRREILEPLFSPWYGTVHGVKKVFVTPSGQDLSNTSGKAVWTLDGLIMTASSITPVLAYTDFQEVKEVEAIPFFDGDTVESEGEDREITLDDIEPDSAPPTQIRSREWETRKFMGKERVREARLKAQIAQRMAEAEEARYYRHFGELDDGESHFSDYDLSESEDEEVLT
jgi:hypothetical protein